ncbi:PAS domain S-box protein, partial [Synechococcus sp. WC101]
MNGCVAGQAAAREELSLPTELKTESAAALYPLLQLLGQLLNVPWVYLELVQPGSHSDSPAKGILYPNPQQIPGNEPPNPIGGSWPFQEAFPLLDEGGRRLATLYLLGERPRQLSLPERGQIDLIALSLRHILLQAQEQRQALEQLQTQLQHSRSTAARYQPIFENAVEGIFQTTPEGKYLVANPALAHIFGYESPEDLMRHVSDIGTQIYGDPEQRSEFVQRMLKEGQVVHAEQQVCRKDGKKIWISLNARALYNEQGEPLYFEGFVTDITASRQLKERQQQLEEARRESEHRFLQLAENSQQLFWISTLCGKELIYVSPACEAIWGLSPAEAYANPQAWMRRIHPDDRWLFPAIFQAQLQGQPT